MHISRRSTYKRIKLQCMSMARVSNPAKNKVLDALFSIYCKLWTFSDRLQHHVLANESEHGNYPSCNATKMSRYFLTLRKSDSSCISPIIWYLPHAVDIPIKVKTLIHYHSSMFHVRRSQMVWLHINIYIRIKTVTTFISLGNLFQKLGPRQPMVFWHILDLSLVTTTLIEVFPQVGYLSVLAIGTRYLLNLRLYHCRLSYAFEFQAMRIIFRILCVYCSDCG